jgi:response regulator NasT
MIIRMDLRQMLEANGFEVIGEARDGVEAIAAARELEPDIVLLDIRMPGVDGVECARRIYAERPVPIVMVTAHGDRGLVERALAAGAFVYLTKPSEADLIPAIRSAVIRHAIRSDARRALGRAERRRRRNQHHVERRTVRRCAWSGDRMEGGGERRRRVVTNHHFTLKSHW